MNISATSASSVSKPVDSASSASSAAAGATPADPAVVGAGGDAHAALAAFGEVLSRTIAKGGETDVAPTDGRDPARADLPDAPDLAPALVTTAAADVAGTAASLPPVAAALLDDARTVRGTGKPDDARRTAHQEPDAVTSDLAAQLALASQWAGLASAAPVDGTTPPPATGTVDVKAKLDTIRTAALRPGVAPDARTALARVAADATSSATDAGRAALPVIAASTAVAADPTSALGIAAMVAGRPRGDSPVAVERDAGDTFVGRLEAAFGDANASIASPVATTAFAAVAASAAAAPTPASTPAMLHAAVGTPAWSQEVGQAALRLAAGDLQSASLRLNPEHLGPMEVQVRIADGIAHLAFTAAHVETRQALEASRPTLDAMFADQGLSIGNCAVGDSGSSQRRFDADGTDAGAARRDDGGTPNGSARRPDEAAGTTVTTRLLRGLGMVDTFA